MNLIKRLFYSNWLGYLIFYGWNLLYVLVIITLESSERVFSELIYNVFTSYTPVEYLFNTAVVCIIPFFCLFIGWKLLNNDRNQLLKWFYGFQVPLSFLVLFRLGGFNEVTTPILLYFILLLIPVVGYGIKMLLKSKISPNVKNAFTVFQVFVGAGVGAFLLIYTVPIVWIIIRELISDFPDIRDLFQIGFLGFILGVFFLATGTLTVFFPIALIVFYTWEGIQELWTGLLSNSMAKMVGAISLASCVFLVYPRDQPQTEALKMAKGWMSGEISNAELLANQESIRTGLVNSYLWRYRYIGRSEDEYGGVNGLYEEAFGSKNNWITRLHDIMISPFVYQGKWEDKEEAAEYYEQIFDTPIEREEKTAIIDAMRNSFQLRGVEATILSIDQKQVEVTDRDIKYNQLEDGVVEVFFHERYENRSYQNQEVFYYFTVPQNTVITGMWLGDNDENLRQFPYTIAPRGAAQKTYQAIKAVRRDPSLLEQVGPYQYRLRIFPVLPRDRVRFRSDDREIEVRPMHLTLRLLTKADENGKIQLPQLTEKRNVYWDQKNLADYRESEWFPSPETTFEPSKPDTEIEFENTSVSIAQIQDLPKREVTDEFALIVDGSYSMGKHTESIHQIIQDFPFRNNLDVYVLSLNELKSVKVPFSFDEFVGNNYPMKTISTWQAENQNKRIVWLTDKGSYELLQRDSVYKASTFSKPIDVLHVNGYSPIYDDAFIETVIQSGGNVYSGLDELVTVIETETTSNSPTWIENGVRYRFAPDSSVNSKNSFAAYYASRMAMAFNRNKKDVTVKELDELHKLAVKHSFVSPYSSMICLVDDEQRRMLEELSKKEDRFERSVENGKTSGNLNLMASPEPHEWLMIIAALVLFLFLYKNKIL